MAGKSQELPPPVACVPSPPTPDVAEGVLTLEEPVARIPGRLRVLERDVVRPEERRQASRVPQVRMQHAPVQEALEGPSSVLDKVRESCPIMVWKE